jgi:hypothetical protein
MFATNDGWPGGVIATIWVNENAIDITTTPTASGQPATVEWRPKTASVTGLGSYIHAKSGRQLAYAIYVNDVGPLKSIADVTNVFEDEANLKHYQRVELTR